MRKRSFVLYVTVLGILLVACDLPILHPGPNDGYPCGSPRAVSCWDHTCCPEGDFCGHDPFQDPTNSCSAPCCTEDAERPDQWNHAP